MNSRLDTINLVKFLAGLKKNNNKAWFESHRDEYQHLREQFLETISDVVTTSAAGFAPEIENLDPKKCTFRIFRDTRFAADKSPYKTNFGALLPIAKGQDFRAGYYIHIGADNRMMAGTCTHPLPPAPLANVRSYIATHHQELEALLLRARKHGLKDLDGEKQKTVPRGFSKDHPASEFLKYKSFKLLAVENATDCSENLVNRIVTALRRSQPFADFIRSALL